MEKNYIKLRRPGFETNVLCGIAANIWLESTAREAFHYGYNQIINTIAMTTFSKEEHEATCSYIFPKIGEVRTSQQLFKAVSDR